jgi:hypothetical protein
MVLIAERVAADDNGFDPTGDRMGDALEDDWLAGHSPAEDIATSMRASSGVMVYLLRNDQDIPYTGGG